MAVIATGTGGNVTVSGGYATAPIRWTLEYTGVPTETTAFGDTVRKYAVGIVEWGGTYTCRHDDTSVIAIPGAITSLVLTAASGQTYTGANAVATGYSVSTSFDGQPEITVTFRGSGTLVIA